MKVSELFKNLSYGELSNLAISEEGSGNIVDNKQPQIIQYANEGLIRLFSRFNLRQKDVIVELYPHITYYYLRSRFAVSHPSSNEPYRYIRDREGDPFIDDVIKILDVKDIYGNKRVLNDVLDNYSVFTPQPDIIQILDPKSGALLFVTYQARHPVLDTDSASSSFMDQDIDVPFFCEGALFNFIGHKVYCHMNGPENTTKSQELLQNYELICAEIEQKDLMNQTFSTNQHKLEQKGFV